MRLVLAAILSVAALGCSESATPERERPTNAAEDADPTSEPIVIGLPQLPRKFDPLDDMEPWAVRIADDLVFEGLVRRTDDRYPWAEPALADECVIDPDYGATMITCHIPRGIRFHDGSELSMADVDYSLRAWMHDRREWLRQRHGLPTIGRLEIVDGPRGATPEQRDRGRWIRVVFDKTEPLGLEALSVIKIVPEAAHRGRSARFARAPIGTGPMRLTTVTPDRLVLDRFEGYRRERPGAPDKLTLRAIDDGAVALTALRRGEIHLLAEVAPSHVPVELGKPGMAERFQAWLVSPASYDVLLWNLRKGLSGELELREALNDAVPRAAIARELYASPSLAIDAPVDLHRPSPIDLEALIDIRLGEPVRGGLIGFAPLDEDLAGAKRAAAKLDKLGWKAGHHGLRRRSRDPLRINLARDDHEGLAAELSAVVRAAWLVLGIRTPDSATSWRFLFSTLNKAKFRVALLRLGGHSDEDLSPLFHSRGAINFAGVDDRQLDEALAAYKAAVDRAGRDAAKQRIAERLAELRVITVVHAPTHVTLASLRLSPLEFVDDLPRLDTLSLQ